MKLFEKQKPLLWLVTAGLAGLSSLPVSADETNIPPEEIDIVASRLNGGVVGASTTIITAVDIQRDPAASLPDILARQAGVQMQSLYGGVNGAGADVSLRGFGSTASENTLILVNGRRINDPDQSGVDFSAIPLDGIERVEITRGNSAAVLYGDGVTGGVINIVTKTGFNAPSSTALDFAYGSFNHREVSASTNQNFGGTSLSLYVADINTDGYRENNGLIERNFDAEYRQKIDQGVVYINLRGDDQHLGLPSDLLITPTSNPFQSDPRSTTTPFDYADLQSLNLSLGGTRTLVDGIDLVIDGGIRHKDQEAYYLSFGSYSATALTTISLTPRIEASHQLFALPAQAIAGFDFYQNFYQSDYSDAKGDTPYDHHSLQQQSYALYGQESFKVRRDTDIALGLRLQRIDVAARESVNMNAPGYYGSLPGNPYNGTDNEYAAHLGIDHRLNEDLTLFGRLGHSMRVPNIDDRNYVLPTSPSFLLKTQTSDDVEVGTRANWGKFDGQLSGYVMNLHDEIDYDPGANGGFGANVNLDPTQRSGVEAEAGLKMTDSLRLKAAVTYTDATFRSGPYKGNEVPQVAALTGNIGFSWDIWKKLAVFDATARYVGARRLGDDQANAAQMEPAYKLVDLKLGGSYQWVRWSVAVQNLFNAHYYDQGFVGFTPGSYSVYPMPGRNFMSRLGVTF